MNIKVLIKKINSKTTVKDFLKETNHLIFRPRVVCKDGFSINVEASEYHYCYPKKNGNSVYEEVELGYPSTSEDIILKYADDPINPQKTIYRYVPITVVKKLIRKHGGIVRFNEHSL